MHHATEHAQALAPESAVEGLVLMDNTWGNFNMPHNATVVLDERGGSFFSGVKDMIMIGNVATPAKFDARAVRTLVSSVVARHTCALVGARDMVV
jgi:hypothetical protein